MFFFCAVEWNLVSWNQSVRPFHQSKCKGYLLERKSLWILDPDLNKEVLLLYFVEGTSVIFIYASPCVIHEVKNYSESCTRAGSPVPGRLLAAEQGREVSRSGWNRLLLRSCRARHKTTSGATFSGLLGGSGAHLQDQLGPSPSLFPPPFFPCGPVSFLAVCALRTTPAAPLPRGSWTHGAWTKDNGAGSGSRIQVLWGAAEGAQLFNLEKRKETLHSVQSTERKLWWLGS